MCPRTRGFQATWDELVTLSERQTSVPTPSIPVTACDFQAGSSLCPSAPLCLLRFLPHHAFSSWLCLLSLSPCLPCPSSSHCVPLVSSLPVSPVLFLSISSASSASLPLLSVTESLSLVSSSAPEPFSPIFPLFPSSQPHPEEIWPRFMP